MGSNRLFYASDWPHWDNEYPDSLYHIWQREDLTEEQKRGILRDNAAEMYGLDNGS
jgi:predicted TIM-barrel fold metal-dependent hydrolase